jgi:hypothetical protein
MIVSSEVTTEIPIPSRMERLGTILSTITARKIYMMMAMSTVALLLTSQQRCCCNTIAYLLDGTHLVR